MAAQMSSGKSLRHGFQISRQVQGSLPAGAAVSYVARGSLKKSLPYDRVFGALATKEETIYRRPDARNHVNLYDFIADINQKEALGNRKTVIRQSTKQPKPSKE